MLLDVVSDSSHRLQYTAKFLGAKEAMVKLHDNHLKTKRLHEPATDTQEKMMQWDVECPKTEVKDDRQRHIAPDRQLAPQVAVGEAYRASL